LNDYRLLLFWWTINFVERKKKSINKYIPFSLIVTDAAAATAVVAVCHRD